MNTHLASLRQQGIFLHQNYREEEAIACYRQVLAEDCEDCDTWSNLGLALCDCGEYEEGLASFERALQLDPHHLNAKGGRSLFLLLLERYEEGWHEYSFLRQTAGLHYPAAAEGEYWKGTDLQGKTVLLLSEQGAGDTLQFVRYAALFKEKGATVLICCSLELSRLLNLMPSIDGVVIEGGPIPPHDFFFFLMDSPRCFGTLPSDVPNLVPYLFPPEASKTNWLQQMGEIRKKKVGIVWAGNPNHRRDARRSLHPELFSQLFTLSGYQFFSLQKENSRQFSSPYLIDMTHHFFDFAETAAFIACLDLVISVDTSVAHLAAAMGKPVYLLLPYAPDWRWLLHRSDSIWYPTMRLFRQKTRGDWAPVMQEVANTLMSL